MKVDMRSGVVLLKPNNSDNALVTVLEAAMRGNCIQKESEKKNLARRGQKSKNSLTNKFSVVFFTPNNKNQGEME